MKPRETLGAFLIGASLAALFVLAGCTTRRPRAFVHLGAANPETVAEIRATAAGLNEAAAGVVWTFKPAQP